MRILNRPLALLLALALIAVGVIVTVEVVAFALNTGPAIVPWPSWQHWALTTRWNRAVVKVWSIVLIVFGLLLLVIELKPRRVKRLALTSDTTATDAAMTKRGLVGAVRTAVLGVDGISAVDVTVRRRAVNVSATAAARDQQAADELSEPVTNAAQSCLDDLRLESSPSLHADVTTRSR